MFPEHRLLHEELDALNRNAENEKCVIIVAKVVGISQMIVISVAGLPRVDAHCV
jgi:hypothetical protein